MSQENSNEFIELERIKAIYFSSRFINLKNFLTATQTELPEGVNADDLLHWNQEKKKLKEASTTTYEGIKTMYTETLMERLDAMERINGKIMKMLAQVEEIKDIKTLVQAMETVAKLQDNTIQTLNIDTSSDGQYNKSKQSTDDLLKVDDD